MTDSPRPLRVAMIGAGFMGAAHSQGWRVAPRFFELGANPEMALLVGRDQARTEDAARKWGWAETSTDTPASPVRAYRPRAITWSSPGWA